MQTNHPEEHLQDMKDVIPMQSAAASYLFQRYSLGAAGIDAELLSNVLCECYNII